MLADGTKEVPLRLRIKKDGGVVEKEFADGISAGMGKSLSFHVPVGVYQRFTVLAGLHPELGRRRPCRVRHQWHGKQLASVTLNGDEPAHRFDCDLTV